MDQAVWHLDTNLDMIPSGDSADSGAANKIAESSQVVIKGCYMYHLLLCVSE